jgi:hypothetical protein
MHWFFLDIVRWAKIGLKLLYEMKALFNYFSASCCSRGLVEAGLDLNLNPARAAIPVSPAPFSAIPVPFHRDQACERPLDLVARRFDALVRCATAKRGYCPLVENRTL